MCNTGVPHETNSNAVINIVFFSGTNILPEDDRSTICQSAVKKLVSINSGEPWSSWGKGKRKKR